jgi:hypothetical protein
MLRSFTLIPMLRSGTLICCLPLLLAACQNHDAAVDTRGVIAFTLTTDPDEVDTRVDENSVHDLHILVYNRRGRQVGNAYFVAAADYRLEVPVGNGYTVYAFANTNNPTLFDDARYHTEAAVVNHVTPTLSLWIDLELSAWMLLSGKQDKINVAPAGNGGSVTRVALSLTRVASRINLNVTTPTGSGIVIDNFAICSLPNHSYFLPRPLGGVPAYEAQSDDRYTLPGEDAPDPNTDAHWMGAIPVNLAPGATAFGHQFYSYENRQGVNPALTQQKDKNSRNAPRRASYLLVNGNAPGYKKITWRIYFGANATNNFNIKRNATYSYNITLRPNETDMRVDHQK